MKPYTESPRGFPAEWFARLDTHRGVLLLVFSVYFLSSFVSANLVRYGAPPPGEWTRQYDKYEFVMVSRPRVLRGDEMHYLLMANSLGRDGDLRLSWDYADVLCGGLGMGFWHRRYPVRDPEIHFTRMNDTAHGQFSLIGKHPIGLSAVLAVLLWPLAGTAWMEAACIWITVIVAVIGLHFLLLILQMRVSWPRARNTALLVAFATPYWSYARTLYTEVYMAMGYLVVLYLGLRGRAWRGLPLLGVLAWFKYPALLMFLSAGVGEWLQRRRRNFFLFGAVGAATLAAIALFNRWFFYRAGFMFFGGTAPRTRVGLGAPIAWIPGDVGKNLLRLLKDTDKGLAWFTPLLFFAIWGLCRMWRRDRELFKLILCCALPWFALHLSYRYLLTGDSYSTRYLVPVVPLAMLGIPWFLDATRSWFWRILFAAATTWSLACNAIAGIFPAVSFAHTPFEMFRSAAKIARALAGH